jgi:hypothetical protein
MFHSSIETSSSNGGVSSYPVGICRHSEEGKIAVVVGKVTDDKRLLEVPQDGT